MSEEKTEILAVHKQKLEQFLGGLELYEPLLRHELKCLVCDEIITMDNIGAIIPCGDNIALCCSKHDCLRKATKHPVEVEPEEVEPEDAE